jgi:hypothetical protein
MRSATAPAGETYRTRSGNRPGQRADELAAFKALLIEEGVRSYLEVGARYGDTLWEIATALPRGSRVVAVDMPGGAWGRDDSRPALTECIKELCFQGYDASVVFGPSETASTIALAMRGAPFDAALIDGDHRIEGVVRDWINYGGHARIVALHDIDGAEQFEGRTGDRVDVPFMWSALKRRYRHREIVGSHRGMGIGILWTDSERRAF